MRNAHKYYIDMLLYQPNHKFKRTGSPITDKYNPFITDYNTVQEIHHAKRRFPLDINNKL